MEARIFFEYKQRAVHICCEGDIYIYRPHEWDQMDHARLDPNAKSTDKRELVQKFWEKKEAHNAYRELELGY